MEEKMKALITSSAQGWKTLDVLDIMLLLGIAIAGSSPLIFLR
jgi:hypothetical protein